MFATQKSLLLNNEAENKSFILQKQVVSAFIKSHSVLLRKIMIRLDDSLIERQKSTNVV